MSNKAVMYIVIVMHYISVLLFYTDFIGMCTFMCYTTNDPVVCHYFTIYTFYFLHICIRKDHLA